MTGAACVSPDTAPAWSIWREAANGRKKEFSRGSVSLDFVFASLLFILILGYCVVAYSGYSEAYIVSEQKRSLEGSAVSISGLLVKSRGYPENWEQDVSGLEVLGLAESENVLSRDKVTAFDSLSYNDTKGYFGIGNEYYITIKSMDGLLFFSKGTEYPNHSSVSIERIVYYNRSVCRLLVRMYD